MQKNIRLFFLIISCIAPHPTHAMETIDEKTADELYQDGLVYRFTDKNFDLAHTYISKAAEKGHIEALNELGSMANADHNISLAKNYFVRYLERKKEKKCTNDDRVKTALHALAHIYETEKEQLKAIECYETALEQGSTYACLKLARLYRDEEKIDSAEFYYEKRIQMAEANKETSDTINDIKKELAEMHRKKS